MKEHEYYNELANWSFDEIKYTEENYTNWVYEDEIKKYTNKNSKVLDLGSAGGEKLLRNFPECSEILGTDFSEEMIKTANENLKRSGRKNICFRVMDNLNMDTPDNYFDLVTARHTVIDAKQIYKTLKKGGYLILRGVDKLDCWSLKMMFGRGQAYHDTKPISQIDYEAIIEAGFTDAVLIPLHVVEYYKTKEDLYALLLKTPILNEFSEDYFTDCDNSPIEHDIFEEYVANNTSSKGIKLVRRYYGIIAHKT